MIAAQEKPDYGYSLPVYEAPSVSRGRRPRGRARGDRRTRVVLTTLILSVFVLGLVYALCGALTTNTGYRLENLKSQVAGIEAENQALEMLINKRDTLTRIEAKATAELGMVAVTEENTLVVAVTDSSATQLPPDRVSSTAATAEADRPSVETRVGEASDPGLLEVLFSFISRHEAGVKSARAG